jgi:hypothetical protein
LQLEAKPFCANGLTSFRHPGSLEFIGEICFYEYASFVSVLFEPGSGLSRRESRAFCRDCLTTLRFLASVENISEWCFSMQITCIDYN